MAGYEHIIGENQIKEHFRNAIKYNKISHSYIISGESGMGKKTLAKAFAMALQCENKTGEPCMECVSCKQALSGNHPDIIWVTHDKDTVIGIDEIREQLVSDIQIKPYKSQYKIYIVDDAQKMNVATQNAVLKTIEEPPEYGVVIFLTTNMDMFLQTILSRCIKLNVKPLQKDVIKKQLMKEYKIPDYRAEIISSFSGGNMGKAIRLASSERFNELKDEVVHLIKYIGDMEVYEMVAAVKRTADYKSEIEDYLDMFVLWFRDVLMYKASKDVDELLFKEELSTIAEQAGKASYNGLESIIDGIDKAKVRLRANVNFDLTVELMFLNIRDNLK
ncbi:MAG: DNA polymerase III subunit delta' [Lachnospiraceae bacterium]|nr:DNA polymerase III subunit delta' [Lachnospiraceae bacterium]MBQ4067999.1 DNA polymerase III subunit delta' [Lachnospiraceae bacterium]